MIRIYDLNMKLIRSRCRIEPRHFTKVIGVEGSRGSLEQSLYYWRSRVGGIGEGAAQWADALIENSPRWPCVCCRDCSPNARNTANTKSRKPAKRHCSTSSSGFARLNTTSTVMISSRAKSLSVNTNSSAIRQATNRSLAAVNFFNQ